MAKLKPHSLWLLRFLKERMEFTGGGGYCVHLPLPLEGREMGISMSTLRGLEKRGLAEEFMSGGFRPTKLGLKYLEENKNEPQAL